METEVKGLPGYIRRSGYIHGMFILVVLVLAALSWGWLMQVTVERIDVRNTVNADVDQIHDLAAVDTGAVLFDVEPSLIADRVKRDPWVRTASVTRLPTGTLIISVRERAPVARVLGSDGRQDFYLDSEGFQMPPSTTASYDVPLFFGYPEAYHPTTPTESPAVTEILSALAAESETTGPLISEIIYRDEEIWLQLEPSGRHGSTPVRIGRSDFRQKFLRLAAFWNQRMIPRQDRKYEHIDLRFSSQIITREQDRE